MQITFDAELTRIGSCNIVILPLLSSEQLPSRGMVMVAVTLNGMTFLSPLEPDGKGSHWFEVSDKQIDEMHIAVGQMLSLTLEPASDWPDPEMPQDVMDAIAQAGLLPQWRSVTVKAKWEWLRWIRSTSNPETRKKRILVACSKLSKGDKRPCCFDSSRCTVPDVSKSGVLIDPYAPQGTPVGPIRT